MSTVRVKVTGPDALTLFKGMAAHTGTRVRESDYVGWQSIRRARPGPASLSGSATTAPTEPYCYLVVKLDTFVSHLAKLSEK